MLPGLSSANAFGIFQREQDVVKKKNLLEKGLKKCLAEMVLVLAEMVTVQAEMVTIFLKRFNSWNEMTRPK